VAVALVGAFRGTLVWSGADRLRLRHPAHWLGGPVVGIHLRRDTDGESTLGPGLWLGPLRERHGLAHLQLGLKCLASAESA